MNYYESNLESIKKNQPELYQGIMEKEDILFHNTEDIEIITEKSRDNNDILTIIKNEKKWSLNSTYKPVAEAIKYAEQFNNIADESKVIFFGLGNGLFLKEIAQKGNNVQYVFIEPSIKSFLYLLENVDIAQFLENDKVKIFVIGINHNHMNMWYDQSINYKNWLLIFFKVLPKYNDIFPEECRQMEDTFYNWKKYTNDDAYTYKNFSKTFVKNAIHNMKYIANCNCLSDFYNVFSEDMPAILVSAGPSLDKNIEELREAKGKALIVAVDTAIKHLLKRDIIPDFIVTVDASKALRHFEDERIKNIPVFVQAEGSTSVLEKINGARFVFASAIAPYYNKLFSLAGREVKQIPTGGSVSHSAFIILQKMGFKRIILIGQDLAMINGQFHPENDVSVHDKVKDDLFQVEGINGEMVFTRSDYYNYLQWFEMAVDNFSDIDVIDATEGGALIHGTKIMPLKEVIQNYCTKEYEINEIINSIPRAFTANNQDILLNQLKESMGTFNKITRQLKEGASLSERALVLVQREGYSEKEFKEVNSQLKKICVFLEDSPEANFIQVYSAAQEIDAIYDLYLGEKNEQQETIRLFEKSKRLYESMYEASKEVSDIFAEEVNNLIKKKSFYIVKIFY